MYYEYRKYKIRIFRWCRWHRYERPDTLLLIKGKLVAGYDRTPSELTEHLIAEGAQIHYEENVDLIPEACKNMESTLVVYTPAVPQKHAELVYFRNNGFEIQNGHRF